MTDAPPSTASTTTTAATLNSEAWEVDTANATEPNPGTTPIVFRPTPSSGTAYLATVLTVTSGTTVTSSLVVTDVGTGASTSYTLPFMASTQPYIDASGNMFVGDGSSNVWEAQAFTTNGALSNFASSGTWTVLNDTSSNSAVAANFGTSATTSGGASSLTAIGGAIYNGVEYLRLQSATRLTLLENGSLGWQPLWTTTVSANPSAGGDSWDATSGTYVPDPAIAALPTGSAITSNALIVNGAVMLPVTVPPASTSTNACATPTAYLYLYQLGTGAFPDNTYQDAQGNFITGPILVGDGTAYTPALAIFDGQMRIQVASSLGAAPSSSSGAGGATGTGGTNGGGPPPLPPPVKTPGPPVEGPAGWRQLL